MKGSGIFTNSHGAVLEVACSAHARRYWYDAKATDPVRAHHALGVFARLYQIELEKQLAQIGARGREEVRRRFPPERMAAEHASLYEELISEGPGSSDPPASLPDSQARAVTHRHASEIRYIDVVDPGILDDIDEPEAYHRLLQSPQ